jgi:hypothetical protein
MSNKINPEFIENQVGIMIQYYLTSIAPKDSGFLITTLSSKEELRTGADALLRDRRSKMMPFYMQFKRPEGYLCKAGTAGIIRDRNSLRLKIEPHALFFELRKKAKTAKDYQHNLLFGLKNQGCHAVYVCPLFLEMEEYANALTCVRFRLQFWFRRILKKNPIASDKQIPLSQQGKRKRMLDGVPHLPGHIAFPPHDRVTTHNHKYSFSVDGDDLCFHSPERIERDPLPFLDFIRNVFDDFSNEEQVITVDNANDKINKLIERMEPDFRLSKREKERRGNPFYGWIEWGKYLRKNYNIHQYAMIFRERE